MSDYENTLPYQEEFEKRARELVSRMTLDEIVTQTVYTAASIPRLGVPYYNWWNEALHGVARAGVATVFPQAIGLAAAFDEDLVRDVADIISTEGRAKHHEAVRQGDRSQYRGLTFWSPNINIFRDPRWGRGHETYGEDPWLTGRLGAAFVRGIQGDHPKYLKAAACVKHFAVHSGPEGERHSFDAVVSEKDLNETYLPAFRHCVTQAGAESVMGAYNRVNGEPCCGSQTLLRKILRGRWGFKGHVVSDCGAIKDFHTGHLVTHTAPESAAMAVNNGCDLNCGNMYLHLMTAHQEGLITEDTIRQAAVRLFTTRMKLGLFDDPSDVPFAGIPYEKNNCPEHREFALVAARRSMVLLKNDHATLPLDKNTIKTLAVVGPNANNRESLIGNYAGTPSCYVTVLEGIQDAVGDQVNVIYAQGCHIFRSPDAGWGEADPVTEAVSAAERADAVICCLGLDGTLEGEEGEFNNSYSQSGDKPSLDLPGRQSELLRRMVETGKPVILVHMSGSAMALGWADEHVPAIIQTWYPGGEGGRAVASLIFGEYSPSGRLPVTFYRTTGELPDFHDYAMKNRTYRYMTREALYPFGFGLSYSTFAYGEIKSEKTVIHAGEPWSCKVSVQNLGPMDARETVQLYLRDIETSTDAPRWQLKGVRTVSLAVGQTTDVSFTIEQEDMTLVLDTGESVLEPGAFEVFIGGSQPDSRSQALTGQTVKSTRFEVRG